MNKMELKYVQLLNNNDIVDYVMYLLNVTVTTFIGAL